MAARLTKTTRRGTRGNTTTRAAARTATASHRVSRTISPVVRNAEAADIDSFVGTQRDRLEGVREGLREQISVLDGELAQVEMEIQALDQYDAARHGRPAQAGTRKRSSTLALPAPAPGARGSKRRAVLDIISRTPDGVTRGDIINALGAKGDKTGEGTISNALTAFMKRKQITRTPDRRYVAAN